METDHETSVNLSRIEEIAQGDQAFILRICQSFLQETIHTEKWLSIHLRNKKYQEIKDLLHQCRPRFELLNDIITATLIEKLEQQIEKGKIDDEWGDTAKKVTARLQLSIQKMKMIYDKKINIIKADT